MTVDFCSTCSFFLSLPMFIVTVMHQNNKADSLYVKTYLAINLIYGL